MLPQQRDVNLLPFVYKYDTDIDFFFFLLNLTPYHKSEKSNPSVLEPCFEAQHRTM